MSDVLSRSFDFTVTRSTDTEDDGLTLEGYAAVFNSPTEIEDRLGVYTETIARGAFSKTINERTPVLQFDHGTHPMIGSIPLGSITHIREDDQGLFVRARLSDNWLVQPVRDAIASGAITGMSFRFQIPEGKETWSDGNTQRTIHEVRLYELGPVVFPAYESTTVGVRSKIRQLLKDDNVLVELARALAFGTEDVAEEGADSFTPSDAPDEPVLEPLAVNRAEKARPFIAAAFLLSQKEKTAK